MAEKRKFIQQKNVAFTVPVIKTPEWWQGFVDFIREQGVVGLATGLVLGLAAKSLIDSLISNIFNPIIGVLTGGISLQNKVVCIKHVDAVCKTSLNYGQFISDFISFVVVVLLVYFVFRILKLDKLAKKKEG